MRNMEVFQWDGYHEENTSVFGCMFWLDKNDIISFSLHYHAHISNSSSQTKKR